MKRTDQRVGYVTKSYDTRLRTINIIPDGFRPKSFVNKLPTNPHTSTACERSVRVAGESHGTKTTDPFGDNGHTLLGSFIANRPCVDLV